MQKKHCNQKMQKKHDEDDEDDDDEEDDHAEDDHDVVAHLVW